MPIEICTHSHRCGFLQAQGTGFIKPTGIKTHMGSTHGFATKKTIKLLKEAIYCKILIMITKKGVIVPYKCKTYNTLYNILIIMKKKCMDYTGYLTHGYGSPMEIYLYKSRFQFLV